MRPSYITLGHIPKGCYILPQGHFLETGNNSQLGMNKESLVHFHDGAQLLKKKRHHEIGGKWIELKERNCHVWVKPDSEWKIWYVFT